MCRERLLFTAYRKIHCPAEAQDLVQFALLKSWRHLGSFRGQAAFSTWLTRILLNEIHMYRRRSDYRRLEYQEDLTSAEAVLVLADRLPQNENPQECVLRKEKVQLLRKMVQVLPLKLRSVLQLDLEEISTDDVAERLALSAAAVKTRRFRGRNELRKRLENQERRSGPRGKGR